MPTASLFRIVIFSRPDDPAQLRDLLQRELGLNKVDAGIAAHHAPGIIPNEWPHDAAARTAEAITHLGLRSVAAPAESLPALSQAETVHHLRCGEVGLEICNLAGAVDRTWPWAELQLISAGRVPLETPHHFLADRVLHAGPRPSLDGLETAALRGFEAWLLFDGAPRVLHFDSEHMNYEYLGDRKSASGTANFELLIADMAVAAPGAFLTPATRKYLTRGPMIEYDFPDSAALQEQTVVQYLLLQQLRGASTQGEGLSAT